MSLARFVESLLVDGRVRVSAAVNQTGDLLTPSSDDLDEAATILTAFELDYRNELPGTPPGVSRSAMLWGALTTFRASSFLAHRDASEQIICQAMTEPCLEVPSPAVCYSVDLTLRFLPDLVRLATAVSVKDPLVDSLLAIASRWPLSSVGIANVSVVDVEHLLENDCLLRLYVDRIVSFKDSSRLNELRIRDAVLAAIGIHQELVPELATVFD